MRTDTWIHRYIKDRKKNRHTQKGECMEVQTPDIHTHRERIEDQRTDRWNRKTGKVLKTPDFYCNSI